MKVYVVSVEGRVNGDLDTSYLHGVYSSWNFASGEVNNAFSEIIARLPEKVRSTAKMTMDADMMDYELSFRYPDEGICLKYSIKEAILDERKKFYD